MCLQGLSRFPSADMCPSVVGSFLMRHRGHRTPTNWISSCLLTSSLVGDHVLAVLDLSFLYSLEADSNHPLHSVPSLWVTRIYSLLFVSWSGCLEVLQVIVQGCWLLWSRHSLHMPFLQLFFRILFLSFFHFMFQSILHPCKPSYFD